MGTKQTWHGTERGLEFDELLSAIPHGIKTNEFIHPILRVCRYGPWQWWLRIGLVSQLVLESKIDIFRKLGNVVMHADFEGYTNCKSCSSMFLKCRVPAGFSRRESEEVMQRNISSGLISPRDGTHVAQHRLPNLWNKTGNQRPGRKLMPLGNIPRGVGISTKDQRDITFCRTWLRKSLC